MKKALLEILACPSCRAGLALRGETLENGEVVAGTLVCSGCAASFEIREGVPCMLPDAGKTTRTRRGFGEQWQLADTGELAEERPDDKHRAELLSEVLLGPMVKPNAWILDAGCGSCDVSYAIAERNPEARLVGLDFCDTIYPAARRARSFANVSFVQGDVMLPPFKPFAFQGVYSWGVLHHTQDTRVALETVARLVGEDGTMVVWLYPHPSESLVVIRSLYLLRDLVFLGRGHLMPGGLRLRMAQVASLLCAPGFLVAFFLDALSMRRRHGRQGFRELIRLFDIKGWKARDFYRLVVFLVFDTLTPERQFRHRQAEVRQWFSDNGFVGVQTHDGIPGYYWGRRRA